MEAGREHYEKAMDIAPDDPTFVAALAGLVGSTASDLDDVKRAIQLHEKAIAMNPMSPGLNSAYARTLIRLGRIGGDANRLQEAADRLRRAVELYPSHVGYRIELAELLLALQAEDEAREHLRAIAEADLPVWEYERPRLEALRARLEMD